MTDSYESSTELADDYLDPQFHEVDPSTITLNDNAELDGFEDESALADLEALDGGTADGESDDTDSALAESDGTDSALAESDGTDSALAESDGTAPDEMDSEAEFAASIDDQNSPATAQGSLFAASTGDPRVDGAVSRLGDLTTSDITEHPAVLEDVHRRLHDALADLDR